MQSADILGGYMKNAVKVTVQQAMQVDARYLIGGTARRLSVTPEFTLVDSDWNVNALDLVSPEWYGPRFDYNVETNYGLGADWMDDTIEQYSFIPWEASTRAEKEQEARDTWYGIHHAERFCARVARFEKNMEGMDEETVKNCRDATLDYAERIAMENILFNNDTDLPF